MIGYVAGAGAGADGLSPAALPSSLRWKKPHRRATRRPASVRRTIAVQLGRHRVVIALRIVRKAARYVHAENFFVVRGGHEVRSILGFESGHALQLTQTDTPRLSRS